MKTPVNSLGHAAFVLSVLLWSTSPATAQVSVGISLPGVSIGINTPVYPQFVRVPNYPVYYAPGLQTNFFFYDGLYWVYQQDNWYSSSWYDGPWYEVGPQAVPLYVLRIPVRYYRSPPAYFDGWRQDAPPRWDEHWGNDWSRQRGGWDRWDRQAMPAPAPLPTYQRQYTGDRYPRVAQQQQTLQSRNYRYRPRDAQVRQRYEQQAVPPATAPRQRGPQGAAPRAPNANEKDMPPGRAEAPRPAQAQGQGQGRAQEPDRGNGNDKGKARNKDKEKDRENTDEPGQQRKK